MTVNDMKRRHSSFGGPILCPPSTSLTAFRAAPDPDLCTDTVVAALTQGDTIVMDGLAVSDAIGVRQTIEAVEADPGGTQRPKIISTSVGRFATVRSADES